MTSSTIRALHDIHTATNDVLKGYREMSARAQPDIKPVIHRLIAMHEGHAAEQAAALARARETGKDDTSLQGTVNKAVVIMRDWFSDLDRDVLPAVRDGEASLGKAYDEALADAGVAGAPAVAAVLRQQRAAIHSEIARLPTA
jgi:hypothetical protein